MNIKEAIACSPIFSSLSEGVLEDIRWMSEMKKAAKGGLIFSEGEEADSIFVVATGVVELVKIAQDGRELLVRRVESGETFAEAAVLSGDSYPVNAVASEDSELVVIDGIKFLNYLRERPEVSLSIMGAMSKLLLHWNALLSALSLHSVESRLAMWILKRSEREGGDRVVLDLKKRDLASLLGTVPETLSRNLRKLADTGAIALDGDAIIINDNKVLQSIIGRSR
jgi:CRP/FNR family transcriptional regulator